MTTAQADVGDLTYEECPAIEYIDMKTGKTIDLLFAPALLCANIDGFTYKTVEPNWVQYPQMWVREVVDLDGDVNSSSADYISHHYAHVQPGPWPVVREGSPLSVEKLCFCSDLVL